MKLFFRRALCALLALSLLMSAAALAEEAGYTALSYGMKDTDATAPAVRALQDRLKALGYMDKSIPSTGGYWNATATALAAFQRAAGLTVNGKLASPETQQALFAADAPAKGGAASTPQAGGVRQGDRGSKVTALQRRLIQLGYLSDKADGDYGPNTAKAVAAFQQASGLTVNGALASEETLAALNAPAAVAATPTVTPIPTATPAPGGLNYRDRGTQVAAMQKRLIELGFLKDVADGIYGQNTAKAVAAFQQASGLTVNGNAASADMLAALNSADAPTASSTTPAPTAGPQTTAGDMPAAIPALKLRDRGTQVAAMQKRLIELGFLKDVADGIYGQNTAKAVAAFQQANGLTVNGNAVSSGTLALLLSSAAAPVRQADIRYKDRGSRVADMQKRLIELGYLKDVADGIYGQNTARALAAFQQASGLTVNGNLATAETLAALNSDAARPAPTAAPTASPTATSTATPTPAPGMVNMDAQVRQPDGSYAYVTVRYGDRGSIVEEMQLKLLNLGYTEDFPDGQFGPKTGEALAAFQQAAGLPVNKREASPELQALLYSGNAPRFVPELVTEDTAPGGPIVKPAEYRMLKAGMTNSADVRLMQDRLRQLGYFKGTSTGNYFDETAAAVKKFSRAVLGASYTKSGQAIDASLLKVLYSEGAPTYAQYTARENGADSGSTGAAVEGYADLRYGDKGDAVARAVDQLRAVLAYNSSDARGEYGASTAIHVAKFQAHFGYPVNGTVLTAEQQKLLFSTGHRLTMEEIRRAEGGVIGD